MKEVNLRYLVIGDIVLATFVDTNYQLYWMAGVPEEEVLDAMREFYKTTREYFISSRPSLQAIVESAWVLVLNRANEEALVSIDDFLNAEKFKRQIANDTIKRIGLNTPYLHAHYVTKSGQADTHTKHNVGVASRIDFSEQIALFVQRTHSPKLPDGILPILREDFVEVAARYA